MSLKSKLKPILPNAPRWEPQEDPSRIVIPGLDTSLPPTEQIEQIEQLITIRLQNIDANLSRIQHLMATRLLPAFKQYAVGTQPVREAASFWTAFFEHAAQIRIPTTEDYTYEQTQPSQQVGDETTKPREQDDDGHQDYVSEQSFDPNVTPADHSFMPGQVAGSSTPMVNRHADETFTSQNTSVASNWLQDSLQRLDRGIQELALPELPEEDETIHPAHAAGQFAPPSRTPKESKGKGKATEPAITSDLRGTVLRHNHRLSNSPVKPTTFTIPPSPAQRSRPKPNPKTPKRNPFLPPDTKNRQHWSGVVDLSKASTTPQRAARSGADSDDDSFELPPGMSPPVTIDFARPTPRIGRTPKKAAAQQIGKALVGTLDSRKKVGHSSIFDVSSSTAPSPPSLARYGMGAYGRDNESTDTSSLPRGISPPTTVQFSRTLRTSLGRSKAVPVSSGSAAPSGSYAPFQPSLPHSAKPDDSAVDRHYDQLAGAGQDSRIEPHTSTASHDTTFENMMRVVGLLAPGASLGGTHDAIGGGPSTPMSDDEEFDVFDDGAEDQTIGPPRHRLDDDEEEDYRDSDSSSDSLDDRRHGAPSAAFIMATERQQADVSSSEDESYSADEGEGHGAVGDDSYERPDDSFTQDFDDGGGEAGSGTTASLFGPRRTSGDAPAPLRMMGQELLEDTIGIGAYMAATGRVQDSPTPHQR